MDNKVKNIYWMLAYAFNTLTDKGTSKVKTEEFDNIYNLFAYLIINSLNYQLKKGLHREYISEKDSINGIKGKILLSESIKQNTFMKHKAVCEYDEFSINSELNQIIKTTLIYLIKNKDLDKSYRNDIKKLLLFFKEVELINVDIIEWNRIRFNKNNLSYKMIINTCYLVLEGLLLTNEKGEKTFNKYIDDQRMSALFEKFVRAYYIKHFPKLNARAMHVSWNIGNEPLGLLPDMKTDITLTYNGKTLIIDTKYYGKILQSNDRYLKKTIRNGHIYQINTYVKNTDKNNTGNVSGMLLYAKTEEDIIPEQTNHMGNNEITITSIDLTKDFIIIMEKLDSIVCDFTNNELIKK